MKEGIRVCEAPGSFAMHKDPAYLHYLCTTPQGGRLPQVIGGTEAKDWNVKQTVRDLGLGKDWTGIQFTGDDAKKGCFFVIHKSVTINSVDITLGVAPYILGKRVKMLRRYQVSIHIGYEGIPYFIDQVHDPKKAFAALQPRYDRHTAGVIAGHEHAVVAGDFNQNHRDLAKKLRLGVAVGDGIIGILARPGLHSSRDFVDHAGVRQGWTDHPALSTTLMPQHAWAEAH